MALTSKLLAPFIGASIMASEEGYDDVAEQCILELSNELQLADLQKAVVSEIEKLSAMDDDTFNGHLAKAGEFITDKEAVLLICLDVLAADGVISMDELSNYFAFADILGLSDNRASQIFDDFVDEMDDLVIEVEDNN